MKIAATHLKRYRQIVALLWKYGRSDIAQQMSSEEGFGVEQSASQDGQTAPANNASTGREVSPENLVDDLEAMGPTYVKLGQVLAGRPDLSCALHRTDLRRGGYLPSTPYLKNASENHQIGQSLCGWQGVRPFTRGTRVARVTACR